MAQTAVSAAAAATTAADGRLPFGPPKKSPAGKSGGGGPDRPTDLRLKKHEKPRRNPAKNRHGGYNNDVNGDNDNSSEDMLDGDEAEDEESVYRKISERRSELNRARRNGDDCHVS